MNKQDLLSIAQNCPSSLESALELAERLTSAGSVAAAFEQDNMRQQRNQKTAGFFNPVFNLAGIASAIFFFCLIFMTDATSSALPHWPAWALASAVLTTIVAGIVASNAEEEVRETGYLLKQAVPIAGTPLCEQALAAVSTGRPEVLAWRDLAIAERGQLYAFDAEIMRAIDEQLTLEEEAQANDVINEEAFHKVHSIGREAFAG